MVRPLCEPWVFGADTLIHPIRRVHSRLLFRCDAGHDLPALSAIQPKIRISREQDRAGEYLRHPNETSVGEAHRNVGVFLHQFNDWPDVLAERESNRQRPTAEKLP